MICSFFIGFRFIVLVLCTMKIGNCDIVNFFLFLMRGFGLKIEEREFFGEVREEFMAKDFGSDCYLS